MKDKQALIVEIFLVSLGQQTSMILTVISIMCADGLAMQGIFFSNLMLEIYLYVV